MIKCWEFEAENRPSFQELHKNMSRYSERIAGYLDMSSPFTRSEWSTTYGEVEEDMPDPGIPIQVYPPSLKTSHKTKLGEGDTQF